MKSTTLSKCLFSGALLLICFMAKAQEPAPSGLNHRPPIRVLFYNLENAYDTIDDAFAGDDAFTPGGPRNWSPYRYKKKIRHIFKVILAAGGWDPPAIVGLCEVESRRVLEDILNRTPLVKYPFRIIHKDSPDPRGIDVAALYDSRQFQLLAHQYLPLVCKEKRLRTREILYMKGLVHQHDTLHLFFNHWPSKWQGATATQPSRNCAAGILKKHVDSLRRVNPQAKVVLAGDFNDPPEAESLKDHLMALPPGQQDDPASLVNLSVNWKGMPAGTQKYRSGWQILDQFIVSGTLLNGVETLHTTPEYARIFAPPYLLIKDETYTGSKPFRTYTGYRYTGGFSDHLPVLLDLHPPSQQP